MTQQNKITGFFHRKKNSNIFFCFFFSVSSRPPFFWLVLVCFSGMKNHQGGKLSRQKPLPLSLSFPPSPSFLQIQAECNVQNDTIKREGETKNQNRKRPFFFRRAQNLSIFQLPSLPPSLAAVCLCRRRRRRRRLLLLLSQSLEVLRHHVWASFFDFVLLKWEEEEGNEVFFLGLELAKKGRRDRERKENQAPHLSCGGKNGLLAEGVCVRLDAAAAAAAAAGVAVVFAVVVAAALAAVPPLPPPDEKGGGSSADSFALFSPPPPAPPPPPPRASSGSGRLVRGFFFSGGWASARTVFVERVGGGGSRVSRLRVFFLLFGRDAISNRFHLCPLVQVTSHAPSSPSVQAAAGVSSSSSDEEP